MCLHGFTDTWRPWDLVLSALVARHDVLAVTLPGHAGGPALAGEGDEDVLADSVERAMDEAGFETDAFCDGEGIAAAGLADGEFIKRKKVCLIKCHGAVDDAGCFSGHDLQV